MEERPLARVEGLGVRARRERRPGCAPACATRRSDREREARARARPRSAEPGAGAEPRALAPRPRRAWRGGSRAAPRRASSCVPAPQATTHAVRAHARDRPGLGRAAPRRLRPRAPAAALSRRPVVRGEGAGPGVEAARAAGDRRARAAPSRCGRPPSRAAARAWRGAWSCGDRLRACRRRGRAPSRRSSSAPSRARRGSSSAAVSSGPIGGRAGEQDGAGVEALVDQHRGDAGLGLAVGDRPLDGGRSAQPGQQRGVDVDGAAGGDVDHRCGAGSGRRPPRPAAPGRAARSASCASGSRTRRELQHGHAAPLGHRLRAAGERAPGPGPSRGRAG